MTDHLATLNAIFKDVVDDDTVILTRSSSAEDVDGWDSLNHIQFVVAIEKRYKLKFGRAEIQSWKTVGDICDMLSNKIP